MALYCVIHSMMHYSCICSIQAAIKLITWSCVLASSTALLYRLDIPSYAYSIMFIPYHTHVYNFLTATKLPSVIMFPLYPITSCYCAAAISTSSRHHSLSLLKNTQKQSTFSSCFLLSSHHFSGPYKLFHYLM